MTGTMWHTMFESSFRGQPVMTEVKLNRWLPEGWSGTADWIHWSSEYKAFVLGDLKTIKPEGMAYVQRDGMKEEHLWQVSAYWWALKKMGLPLVKAFQVYYLPMQPLIEKPELEPLLLEAQPLDSDIIFPVMEKRWKRTRTYMKVFHDSSGFKMKWPEPGMPLGNYINEALAPVQERRQVIRWNKAMGVFDVKLEPHWSAMYCPYPDELCDCNAQKREKIGHYTFERTDHNDDNISYVPRKGYEDITPIELPPRERSKLLG